LPLSLPLLITHPIPGSLENFHREVKVKVVFIFFTQTQVLLAIKSQTLVLFYSFTDLIWKPGLLSLSWTLTIGMFYLFLVLHFPPPLTSYPHLTCLMN
jgi:hypothetical protein